MSVDSAEGSIGLEVLDVSQDLSLPLDFQLTGGDLLKELPKLVL